MPVWTTKRSATDIKAEAEKIGLDWHTLEGVEVSRFDDGSCILVTGDTEGAQRLVAHLIAVGMVEAS